MRLSRRTSVVLLVLFGLALVATLFNVSILSIIQEGNPFAIAWAILKLELGEDEIVPFSGSKLIQKHGTEGPLADYPAQRGCVFKDRLGALFCYSKEGKDFGVAVRRFSRYYIVYELDVPLESLGGVRRGG